MCTIWQVFTFRHIHSIGTEVFPPGTQCQYDDSSASKRQHHVDTTLFQCCDPVGYTVVYFFYWEFCITTPDLLFHSYALLKISPHILWIVYGATENTLISMHRYAGWSVPFPSEHTVRSISQDKAHVLILKAPKSRRKKFQVYKIL